MAVPETPQILKAKGSDCPSLRDLNNFVVPYVGAKWFNLGLQLLKQKDEQKLYNLKANHSRDVEDLCTDMFNHWLQTDSKARWKRVIVALKAPSVNLQCLAQDIDSKLQRSIMARGMFKLKQTFMGRAEILQTTDGHFEETFYQNGADNVSYDSDDSAETSDESVQVASNIQRCVVRRRSVESLPEILTPQTSRLRYEGPVHKYKVLKPSSIIVKRRSLSPSSVQPRSSSSLTTEVNRTCSEYNNAQFSMDEFQKEQTPTNKESPNTNSDNRSHLENQYQENTQKSLAKFKEEFDASQRQLMANTEIIISMQAEKDRQIANIDSTLKVLLIKIQTGFEGIKESKDLQTRVLEITASKEVTAEEISSLKISLNNKVQEIEDLQKKIKHITDVNKDNENISQRTLRVKEQEEELQSQIAEVTDKMALATKKNEELQATLDQNVKENESLQSQIVKLTEIMRAVNSKDEQLQYTLSQNVQESENLRKQTIEVADKLKNKNEELASIHITVAKKSTEIETLQKQLAEITDKEAIAVTNNEQLQRALKENIVIQKQIAEDQKTKDEQLTRLQTELDRKIKENQSLQIQITERADEQKLITGLQATLDQKIIENDSLQKLVTEAVDEQKYRDELCARLQETIDHKTKENETLQKQVTIVTESLKDKSEEFLIMQESAVKETEKLCKEITQHTGELKRKNERLKSFQKLLTEKEQENKVLQKQFAEKQGNENLVQLQLSLQDQTEEYEKLQKKMTEITDELNTKDEHVAILKNALIEKLQENETLKSQMVHLPYVLTSAEGEEITDQLKIKDEKLQTLRKLQIKLAEMKLLSKRT